MGIRASLADSCCASLAIQKKGDASQVAGERRVACAIPASLHRVPASGGGVRSSVTSRKRSTAARRAATSASVARTPPSVRRHHARTSSTASE